ncbi:unnamed protein product, partial [Arctia plantaginis]
MPAWMEAICTDVPEKELMELKVSLGKILEPEGALVGVDEKNLYKFAVMKVTTTPTPDTVLPVLEWFQPSFEDIWPETQRDKKGQSEDERSKSGGTPATSVDALMSIAHPLSMGGDKSSVSGVLVHMPHVRISV